MIKVENLSAGYGQRLVLDNINLKIEPGKITGILGPNGSGKTTLLKTFYRAVKILNGRVLIFDQDINSLDQREIAKLVGVVPQKIEANFPFTVREIIGQGRYPYLNRLVPLSQKDIEVVDKALNLTDCYGFCDRYINELSQGEAQRVFIARALAQEPKVLLLDEPTSNLDINHEIELARLLKQLQKQGLSIIVVSHDLNLAGKICDSVSLLKKRKVFAFGTPSEILTAKNIADVFDVRLESIAFNADSSFYFLFD